MNDIKPTRILFKPEGRGERWKPIVCDTGSYDIHMLAEMIGLSLSGLIKRFRFVGWNHPEVLAAPRHHFGVTKRKEWNTRSCRVVRAAAVEARDIIDHPSPGAAGEFAHLGQRPRNHRLVNIPRPTAWDLSMAAK